MTNESRTDYDGNEINSSRLETVVIVNCALNAPLMLISIMATLWC